MERENVFDRITPDEALEILRRLVKEDQNIEEMNSFFPRSHAPAW